MYNEKITAEDIEGIGGDLMITMNAREKQWNAVAERIGGKQGEEVVSALKELYDAFGREMVAWQAELYSPEHGGFYFSNSARDNDSVLYKGVEHKLLPDVESTIASFGFFVESGVSGGREPKDFLPGWLRKKVADFVYALQDEDGYFYHPQWGKDIGDLRKTRDLGTSIRLLRLDDREPKYPSPTSQMSKEGGYDISNAPERFRSVENFKKYLYEELDFKTKAYHSGSVLSSGFGELRNYGEMLGVDFVRMVIDLLNENQHSDTGLWHTESDYYGTNGVHKISKIYNWSGNKIPYVDAAIDTTMKVMVSDLEPQTGVDVYNPWHVLGELIKNKRKCHGATDAEMKAVLDKIYAFAPHAIRVSAEKVKQFKKYDGGLGGTATAGQASAYGSIVAVPGTNESNINGASCASSALVSSVYYGLDIPDLKVPLFPCDALDEYLAIIEKNERAWRERNGISVSDMQ